MSDPGRTEEGVPVKRLSSLAAAMRHPLVVGGTIAFLSAVFASILVPAFTRSWQDRPRELALKRALVEQIATASTKAILTGKYYGFAPGRSEAKLARRVSDYTKASREWQVVSSVIGSQLTTYFGKTSLPYRWQAYEGAVTFYLALETRSEGSSEIWIDSLARNFRLLPLDDPAADSLRRDFIRNGPSEDDSTRRLNISYLLEDERDQIETLIVRSEASGFSHGFWFFN
jgi:hypothetical protein